MREQRGAGESYHKWGGSKAVFGEGFYGMFSPPLSFPPPLFFSEKNSRPLIGADFWEGDGTKHFRNCLQWGRSNLADPAGSPKINLLNQDFGNMLSIFPRKKTAKHRVH